MRPVVPDVLPLVRDYYRQFGNALGGNLHLVFEDQNIRDVDLEFCKQMAERSGDESGAEIAALMLQMSKTQRRKLASMSHYTD